MLIILFGVVVVLVLIGCGMDFKARRRRLRSGSERQVGGGVDGKAVRDFRRDNETEAHLRGADRLRDPGFWNGGGF